jgi:hypothetical protein
MTTRLIFFEKVGRNTEGVIPPQYNDRFCSTFPPLGLEKRVCFRRQKMLKSPSMVRRILIHKTLILKTLRYFMNTSTPKRVKDLGQVIKQVGCFGQRDLTPSVF